MELARGSLLNHRYRIVEILGQGGMGSVYRAIDEHLNVEVAVKDNAYTAEEFVRQFRREAIFLAHTRHPGLPRVTDYFCIEGQGQYLVMDYVEGEDLRQRMDRVGRLSEEEVQRIGAAVCDILIYLESRRPAIIHRDIKPGNVKITPRGQIVLVDFGLAKVITGSQATTTGARAMTPGYSPPEQYGSARTDRRSDIYSLGATLYAALTGAIPEDSLTRTMGQCELTPVRKHNPQVSRRLASVLEKSLQVRPEDRYQSAEEFKQALLGSRLDLRLRGDFKVAPPPGGDESRSIGDDDAEPLPSLPDSHPDERRPISPLPVSTPLADGLVVTTSQQSRGRLTRLSGPILLVLLGLVMGSTGWALYSLRPATLMSSLSWLARPTATWTGAPPTLPAVLETELPALASPTQTIAPRLTPTVSASASTSLAVFPVRTPTSTTLPSPTPLGGGGLIAFASKTSQGVQIFAIRQDGSQRTQITHLPDGACQPAFSPTGEQLAFVSPCSGSRDTYPNSALFITNLDGSGLIPLQTVPGGDFDPAWSPDGSQIAFTSLRGSGRPQIFLYTLEDNSVTLLSQAYARDVQPAWAPDGKTLVFVSLRRNPAQIYQMDVDGKNHTLISPNAQMIYSSPNWSLDGKLLLFTQLVAQGGIPRVAMASFGGDEPVEYPLVSDSSPMRDARFSPDGFWIVFEGWKAGSGHDIYLIGANGRGKQQLTDTPEMDFDPVWQPSR